MKDIKSRTAAAIAALLVGTGAAYAAGYQQTIAAFKSATHCSDFFDNSYGYAVFPVVGQGSFLLGAAHGQGRVYANGMLIGTTAVTRLSIGLQAGVETYSDIIFFKDQQALDAFESGRFQFGAGVIAVAITAGASASADTTGIQTSASSGQDNARLAGTYDHGVVVFTIVRGGVAGGAAIEGERFSYHARP
jgi:lipid-binding SYLF domain-containing protein